MRRLAALAMMLGALSTTAFVPGPGIPGLPDAPDLTEVSDLPDPDLPVNQVCVYARPVDPDNRYCIQVDDD